jgi:hypothetical protein
MYGDDDDEVATGRTRMDVSAERLGKLFLRSLAPERML